MGVVPSISSGLPGHRGPFVWSGTAAPLARCSRNRISTLNCHGSRTTQCYVFTFLLMKFPLPGAPSTAFRLLCLMTPVQSSRPRLTVTPVNHPSFPLGPQVLFHPFDPFLLFVPCPLSLLTFTTSDCPVMIFRFPIPDLCSWEAGNRFCLP